MTEQHANQTLCGPLGFLLLCLGILTPIALFFTKEYYWFVVGTAGAVELGALLCGVIGWRDLTGKVAAIGGGLLVLLLGAYIAFVLYVDAGIRHGSPL